MKYDKKTTSVELLKNAITLIKNKFKNPSFVFSGKEPLKDEESVKLLLELLDFMRKLDISKVGLITSAMYLETLYRIRSQIKQKLILEISVNSLNREIHNTSRGFGIASKSQDEFSFIEKELLKDNFLQKFATQSGDLVGISTVIFKENFEEIPSFIKTLYQKGFKYFSLGTVQDGLNKGFALEAEKLKSLIRELEQLLKNLPECKVVLTIYPLSVRNIDELIRDILNPTDLILSTEDYNLPYVPILENFRIVPKIGLFSIGHVIRLSSYGLAFFSSHPLIKISFPYTETEKFHQFLNLFYPPRVEEFYLLWKPLLENFENPEFAYPFYLP
jgi:sulfatase maturation enzyme AslB (radical SAM superfamily)